MTFVPEDHTIGQINVSKNDALPSCFGQPIWSNQIANLIDSVCMYLNLILFVIQI